MGRVTGKYMRVGYEDGEDKTHPHPTSLPCPNRESIRGYSCCVSYTTSSRPNILVSMIQNPSASKLRFYAQKH